LEDILPSIPKDRTCYDSIRGIYVPMAHDDVSSQPSNSHENLPIDVSSMKFWDRIFPKAMEAFRAESEAPIPKRKHCIRNKTSWLQVQGELEAAEALYSKTTTYRRVRDTLVTIHNNTQGLNPFLQAADKIEGLSFIPVAAHIWAVLAVVLSVSF